MCISLRFRFFFGDFWPGRSLPFQVYVFFPVFQSVPCPPSIKGIFIGIYFPCVDDFLLFRGCFSFQLYFFPSPLLGLGFVCIHVFSLNMCCMCCLPELIMFLVFSVKFFFLLVISFLSAEWLDRPLARHCRHTSCHLSHVRSLSNNLR